MSATNISARTDLQISPDLASNGQNDFWHCVQFYDDDPSLYETVGRFIGDGFTNREAVIVIATRPHLDAFEERLKARGWDVDAHRSREQYVPLDAAAVLATFMVENWPDQARFTGVMGKLIDNVASVGKFPRLRAFGEMVSLLWGAGQPKAAIRLEELWNDLARIHSFSLLCAYPMDSFRSGHAEAFHRICEEHSHAVPTDRFSKLASREERLGVIAELQQRASSLEDFAGRLIESQDKERSRVVHALHEDISQSLARLAIQLERLRTEHATYLPALSQGLIGVWQQVNDLTEDIHRLSRGLHSVVLDQLGLVPALQSLIDEFSRRHGIPVTFGADSTLEQIPPDVGLCLFRIVQEGLSNIVKHSRARSARVTLAGNGKGVCLNVEDAGVGFDPGAIGAKAGFGFASMRERLRMVQGGLQISSAPSHGTRIEVSVPWKSLGTSPENSH